jgi:hypothetical protein
MNLRRGIYKLQRPLSSNQPNPQILGYDRGRTREFFIDCEEAMMRLFGERLKIYVEGSFDEKGFLYITRIVRDQDW